MKRVLLLLAVLAISGCGITGAQWEEAEKYCKENQGVRRIYSNGPFEYKVECNNGGQFRINEGSTK